ncbi:MAG: sensor histidine kinase, partial [Hyphomicrobiaceae bacterium]
NLAHGLKTPLAVLSAESRGLRKKGEAASADEVDVQVEQMRRNVERELARSRERHAPDHALTAVDQAVTALVSAMKRLPGGDELKWVVDVSPVDIVTLQEDDFNDVFGNLLDNARKWAATTVKFHSLRHNDRMEFIVEDDGPGIADQDKGLILKRGRQLDPDKPGAGLGLAIVQDVLDACGGTLEFGKCGETGLRATVQLRS